MRQSQAFLVLEPLARCTGNACRQTSMRKDIPSPIVRSKALSRLQRICEHHQDTHIVDVAAGSGALAIAAAGSIHYEGIASNDVHRDWLDTTLDRCVMYLAGNKYKEAWFAKLGVDEAFIEKVAKYFSGTMMEARRWLEPLQENEEEDDHESSDGSEDEWNDWQHLARIVLAQFTQEMRQSKFVCGEVAYG